MPSFTVILLAIAVLLLALLCLYAVLIVLAAIASQKCSVAAQPASPDQCLPVTVLIASYNEGPGLLDCVLSLIAQTYAGEIEIGVIVNDSNDTSIPSLTQHFNKTVRLAANRLVLYERNRRRIVLHCAKLTSKKEKLNAVLPTVSSDYVAFLDADHRARPDWIDSSIVKLLDSDAVGVQGAREPLSLRNIWQYWDSAQNHIGNEHFNRFLSRCRQTVFFTGTTCVFRTSALAGISLSDCVTEDTYLSYELILDGKTIIHEQNTGSNEEIAPTLFSYLARRRRWSCGHNQTFFSFLRPILRCGLAWGTKLLLIFHGLFYCVPVAAGLLYFIFALFHYLQFTRDLQVLCLMVTVATSLPIWLLLLRRFRAPLRDIFTVCLWVVPQIVFVLIIVLNFLEHEIVHFIISFPYSRQLLSLNLLFLGAPLIALLIGALKIRALSLWQLVLLVITYPLILFLDILGCLLGFFDFLTGAKIWAQVRRTHKQDVLARQAPALSLGSFAYLVGLLLLLAGSGVVGYQFWSSRNCGEGFNLSLFSKLGIGSTVLWDIEVRDHFLDDGRIQLQFESLFNSKNNSSFELRDTVDGLEQNRTIISSGQEKYRAQVILPAGWKSHGYTASIKGSDFFCSRKLGFTSVSREVRGRDLFVNGEKFLLKGIIPSFSNSATNIDLETGYRQIKELGANAIRIYHAPSTPQKEAIAGSQLLLIDQPDRSTWREVDVTSVGDRKNLIDRFKKLIKDSSSFPYTLLHNVGNELDLLDPHLSVPAMYTLLQDIERMKLEQPYSYSTFYTFLNYPPPLLAINMLDSGQTYWSGALKLISRFEKPFYASEFGGFIAFTERTPTPLRLLRLLHSWDALEQHGALGAVIFESHDNWAQPVPQGYNDPFNPEQPDDLRGLWDRDNLPRPERAVVAKLFSDLSATVHAGSSPGDYEVELTNKRPYKLNKVLLLDSQHKNLWEPFDLEPFGKIRLALRALEGQENVLDLQARYFTHRGLLQYSNLSLNIPMIGQRPLVNNEDFIVLSDAPTAFSGLLLESTRLDILSPPGWSILVGGRRIPLISGAQTVNVSPILRELSPIQVRDGIDSWKNATLSELNRGASEIRVPLSARSGSDAQLILSGLGSKSVSIRLSPGDAWREFPVNNYRENLIGLKGLGIGQEYNGYIYIKIPRDAQIYITAEDNPFHEPIEAQLESPKLFDPVIISVEKE